MRKTLPGPISEDGSAHRRTVFFICRHRTRPAREARLWEASIFAFVLVDFGILEDLVGNQAGILSDRLLEPGREVGILL
jgi:hypothetical protein